MLTRQLLVPATMPESLRSGLDAYWPFDEGLGATRYRDISRNGNHLAPQASPTIAAAPTYPHRAALFTSASSQYANRADNASLRIAGDTTICFWVKPTTVPSDYTEMISKDDNAAVREFTIHQRTSGAVAVYLFNLGVAAVSLDPTTVHMTLSTWNFVAIRFVLASLVVSVAINATSFQSGAAGAAIATQTNAFVVGANPAALRYSNGAMRGLGKWSRILPDAEIAYLLQGKVFTR